MIEVKKKDNESFESMMRRFSRKVQQSGVVYRARKNRYHTRPKSKNLQRRMAVRRVKMNKKREKAKRLGIPFEKLD